MMDSGAWLAVLSLITIVGGSALWLMRLQQQLDSKLSYERHEEICNRSHREKMDAIYELKELIERNEKEARLDRQAMRAEIHTLALEVTAIATVQGQDRPKRKT